MKTKIYRLGRAEFLVYRRSRGTFAQQSRNGCRIKWVRFAADHPPGTMGKGYPTAAKVVQRHGEYSATIAAILDAHAQSKAKKQS